MPDSKIMLQVMDIAHTAGQMIMDALVSNGNSNVNRKSDGTLITEVDIKVNHSIVSALNHLQSSVPILSEESVIPDFSIRKHWQQYWLIDPLDGTQSFLNHSGEFTVNIALIEHNAPVMSVVYVPQQCLTYFAIKACGAWKRDRTGVTKKISTGTICDHLIVALSNRCKVEYKKTLHETLERVFKSVSLMYVTSSLKFCLIADGQADMCPKLTATYEWDTAAAQLILEEAGGSIITHKRRVLCYNKKPSLINPTFFAVGDSNHDWQYIPT